mgnify:FL=1
MKNLISMKISGSKTRKRLQSLIAHSLCRKAVSVRWIISNKGKNTSGIDGTAWKTNKEKEEVLRKLETRGYRASALRRIYIEKFGKKEKHLLETPAMKEWSMVLVRYVGEIHHNGGWREIRIWIKKQILFLAL